MVTDPSANGARLPDAPPLGASSLGDDVPLPPSDAAPAPTIIPSSPPDEIGVSPINQNRVSDPVAAPALPTGSVRTVDSPVQETVPFDFLPLTPKQGSHIPKDLMLEFMRRLMGGLAKGEEAGKDKLDMLTEGHEDYIVDKVRAPYYQINRHQLLREREEGAKHIRRIARADNIPEMEIWRLVRESQQLAQDQRLTQDEAFEQIGGPATMARMKAEGSKPKEAVPETPGAPPEPKEIQVASSDGGFENLFLDQETPASDDTNTDGTEESGDGPTPSKLGFGSSLVIAHENRDLGLQQGTTADPNRYGPAIGEFIPGREMESGLDHVRLSDGKTEAFDRKSQVVLRDPKTGAYQVFPRTEETNEGPLLGVARTVSDAILLGGPGQLIRKGSSLIADDTARAVDKGREINESRQLGKLHDSVLKPSAGDIIGGTGKTVELRLKNLEKELTKIQVDQGTGRLKPDGSFQQVDRFGMVKIVWRHGVKSPSENRNDLEQLMVTKRDITAFPKIVRKFQPIPTPDVNGNVIAWEWVVERSGIGGANKIEGRNRQVIYAVQRFTDGDKLDHVVTIYSPSVDDMMTVSKPRK